MSQSDTCAVALYKESTTNIWVTEYKPRYSSQFHLCCAQPNKRQKSLPMLSPGKVPWKRRHPVTLGAMEERMDVSRRGVGDLSTKI